jgi:branched-chain amino acid transport system substrate-binding protein
VSSSSNSSTTRAACSAAQLEWLILDDESAAANVADLYERLISQEGVDLLMGPYATPLILAALGVAERNGMVLPHHTSVHRRS